ncbi:MAG: GTPase HflX [Candidatus Porifericomitaceae bacterium WSBS_2022_MAG_OTU9]
MFDSARRNSVAAEKALLVHLYVKGRMAGQLTDNEEFLDLVKGSGVAVAGTVQCRCEMSGTAASIGSGQVESVRSAADSLEADIVIFSQVLGPSRERNIERQIKRPVIDRIGLILDIFAQRARSYEGKLQVELAQLHHLSTRLVRGWTHLERQKGGVGLRGPGETQLETDRRLLRNRMQTIKSQLAKVQRSRHENRRGRKRGAMPQVSIVGYSNVGKSTIFNWLTGAAGYVANKPFATLDPLLRRCHLGAERDVLLADTVGFVRDLPDELVNAFRATLEEGCEADLLLHVVDYSDPLRHDKVVQVEQIMHSIGMKDIPRIVVNNCIDKVAGISAGGTRDVVFISAMKKQGREHLLRAISTAIWGECGHFRVLVPEGVSAVATALFRCGAVPVPDRHNLLELDVERGWLEELCARTGATVCE